MVQLNATHDPARRAWIDSANLADAEFPIQNLPFGVFDDGVMRRAGVAIGDQIVDLAMLLELNLLDGEAAEAARACAGGSLNGLMALGPRHASALRAALSDLLRSDSPRLEQVLALRDRILVPMSRVLMALPCEIGDYSDFLTSLHHTERHGRYKGLKDPLPPAFKSLPIAYHGRASSIRVSGARVVRPHGQYKNAAGAVEFGPAPMMDFELELAAFVGQGNELGQPIPVGEANDHIFGYCLLNDWSAKSIQWWEQVLGPFLGKSFVSSISPWIVTQEALAPFRMPGAAARVGRSGAAAAPVRSARPVARRHRHRPRSLAVDVGPARRRRRPIAHHQDAPAQPVLDLRPDGGAPHQQRLQPASGRFDRQRHDLRRRRQRARLHHRADQRRRRSAESRTGGIPYRAGGWRRDRAARPRRAQRRGDDRLWRMPRPCRTGARPVRREPLMLGHVRFGQGPNKVMVLGGAFGWTEDWTVFQAGLDPERATWVFADYRGYGLSRGLDGAFNFDEAAADVLALADSLGWGRFSLVGHSMGGVAIQRVLLAAPGRIERMAAITAVPACSSRMDAQRLAMFSKAATDVVQRQFILDFSTGKRLPFTWLQPAGARLGGAKPAHRV
jgi:2-keto-4-pentenoate hydratase/2-oxohepta-3-ene-1,7-dioic acid hydratase in catechol pathway